MAGYSNQLVKDGWVKQCLLPGHSLSAAVTGGQGGIMPRCEECQGAAQIPEGQPSPLGYRGAKGSAYTRLLEPLE